MPKESSEEPEPEAEAAPTIQQLRKQLEESAKQREQSEKKAAEYLERLQRLQADMENLRKITRRQVDEVTKQASEKLLMKLMPILDALEQAGQIARSGNALPPDEIALGLKMLQEQLTEILSGEGLEEIPSLGRRLNPELHEVVSYLETDEKPADTIVEEVRKGYVLNGKVVRPSLVIVSRSKKTDKDSVDERGAGDAP